MGIIKEPLLVLPFCSLTFSDKVNLSLIENFLEKLFSPIKAHSGIIDFSKITNYYDEEMGNNLKKIYYYFSELQKPDNFHKYKIKTNKYELNFYKNNLRLINLDPGYITEAKLILFSVKDFAHRLYINNGIYAEVQLSYKKNSFTKNPWSYPDYLLHEIILFFNGARDYLRKKLGRK